MRYVLPLLMCMSLVSLLVSLSEATTYYATASGGGSSCSAAQNAGTPIQSLHAGLNCLSGGDTLVLKCGTYSQGIYQDPGNPTFPSLPDGFLGQPTTLTAESPRCATLNPSTSNSQGGNIILLFDRHNIKIDGLTIDMRNLSCGNGSGAGFSGNGMEFVNNEIFGLCGPSSPNGANGIATGGRLESGYTVTTHIANNLIHDLAYGYNENTEIRAMGFYLVGEHVLMENNTFHHIGGYCGEMWSAASYPDNTPKTNDFNIIRNNVCHTTGLTGLLFSSGTSSSIYNNIVYNFNTDPINDFGISIGGVGFATTNFKVYNNTIVGGRTKCLSIRSGSGHEIRNNICWGNNGQDFIENAGASFTATNNLCQGGGCSLYTDPLLTSDYHLLSGSPARNQGVNLSTVFTSDIDGGIRPGGSTAWDLGADQFGVGGGGLPAPTNLRLISTTP